MEFSIKHIDYLSRSYLDELDGQAFAFTPQDMFIPRSTSLALFRLTGVSRFWEPFQGKGENPQEHRYRMEDVLIGCQGARVPLFFLVRGSSAYPEIEIDIGTLETSGDTVPKYEREKAIDFVRQSLPGHYPGIRGSIRDSQSLTSVIDAIKAARFFGIVAGTPATKVTDEADDPSQLDRLIRTMYGSNWGLLVIAQPYSYSSVNSITHSILNEMRQISSAEQTKPIWAPLATAYNEVLEQLKKQFDQGKAVGYWATTVYYFSSEEWHFLKLGAAIRAYYGGDITSPDPLRAFELRSLSEFVPKLGQPISKPEPAPGKFEYPFKFQTLLSSRQLAVFIHLPRLEVPGFTIKQSAYFDVVSQEQSEIGSIEVGDILHFGGPIGNKYTVSLEALQKHALVVGVTGSGKTNTSFYLLKQLWEKGIPFLVLEPAKTEYRSLLKHESMGKDIRVFTLGEEQVSPLRMNPFEMESGVSVSTHIDLLKSVFNASFGMWNPLPQVLERCIHAIYHDRGWDPSRSINLRQESNSDTENILNEDVYPTLTDLYEKIDEVVESLGYEERVKSDIKAALMTRINGLRIGSKGIMLDTHRSIPVAELLSKPTIIELEQIGDDDEKAFIMGLLMTKIYEYLRGHGSTEGTGLKHIVVIEEAHRLLANVPPQGNQEQSNVRGKAVETFTNMLSEIRAYGEGFLVAEQIAVKLSLDVIKNTNLKIIHRTVAGEDRKILGETMNMNSNQCDMLSVLSKGEAAVFVEGDDKPIMVGVPYAKIAVPAEMKTKANSDRIVARHMQAFKSLPKIAPLYTPFDACTNVCQGSFRYCNEARELAENGDFQERFAAFILSVVIQGKAMQDEYTNMIRFVRSRLPQRSLNISAFKCVILNALRWYFDYFGRHYNWSYETVADLKKLLGEILLSTLPEEDSRVTGFSRSVIDQIAKFQQLYRLACRWSQPPFASCPRLCPTCECLFRYHNEILLADKRLSQLFDEGMAQAVESDTWPDMRAILQVVTRLNGEKMPEAIQRSIGLCYGVLQITYKTGLIESARALAIQRLLHYAA